MELNPVSYFSRLWTWLANLKASWDAEGPAHSACFALGFRKSLTWSGQLSGGGMCFIRPGCLSAWTVVVYVWCLQQPLHPWLGYGCIKFLLNPGKMVGRSEEQVVHSWWLTVRGLFNMQGSGREQQGKGNILEAAQALQLGLWFRGWTENRETGNWHLCCLG